MSEKQVGGNIIRSISSSSGKSNFSFNGPYEYFIYKLGDQESMKIDHLASFTIYVLKKPTESILLIDHLKNSLSQGDCVQLESRQAILKSVGNGIELLVAGTHEPSTKSRCILHTTAENIYRVSKPWGHELWINGQHPGYALKQIFIKAGTKTSLQYHNYKRETNVLFEGTCKLHFKQDSSVDVNDISEKDIGTLLLNPLTSIDVTPPTLHRIEAVTDVLLYETSTPHLDDVMRVMDDSSRPDGRLSDEHTK